MAQRFFFVFLFFFSSLSASRTVSRLPHRRLGTRAPSPIWGGEFLYHTGFEPCPIDARVAIQRRGRALGSGLLRQPSLGAESVARRHTCGAPPAARASLGLEPPPAI